MGDSAPNPGPPRLPNKMPGALRCLCAAPERAALCAALSAAPVSGIAGGDGAAERASAWRTAAPYPEGSCAGKPTPLHMRPSGRQSSGAGLFLSWASLVWGRDGS